MDVSQIARGVTVGFREILVICQKDFGTVLTILRGMETPAGNAPPPVDLLRSCLAAEPGIWFPADYCLAHQVVRSALDEPLWLLREAGLIQVTDWVKGRGQGFKLTEAGREAVGWSDPELALQKALDAKAAEQKEPRNPPDPAEEEDDLDPPEEPVESSYYDEGEVAREAFIAPPRPIITTAFLWANCFWFFIGMWIVSTDQISATEYLKDPTALMVIKIGACFGPLVQAGEWWRLLSCAFVHVGLLHLLVNTLALYTIGPVAESIWGRWRVAVLYLLCSVGSSCLAIGLNPLVTIAGASGAIWGLIGAVLVCLIRWRAHLPEHVASMHLKNLLVVIVLNAVLSFAPRVSWEGHLGGFLMGVGVSFWLNDLSVGMRLRRQILGAVGVLVCLVSSLFFLLLMMQYSPNWQRPVVMSPQSSDVIRQLVETVAWPRVAELHQASLAAILTKHKTNQELALQRADIILASTAVLLQNMGESSDPTAQRYRTYLAKLQVFTQLLKQQLASEQLPNSDQSSMLGKVRRELDLAWQELVKNQPKL